MAPGMLDGPMIQFAYQMSVTDMLGSAPEARPLFETIIEILNRADQENQS